MPDPQEQSEQTLVCPNPACPYRRKFGHPAEYQSHAKVCSDCGSTLVQPTAVGAQESGTVRKLDELAGHQATGVQLGQPSQSAIPLHAPPGGWIVPGLFVAGGTMIFVHAILHYQQARWAPVSLAVGLAFVLYGAARLARLDRTRRWVEPFDEGFVYRTGNRSASLRFEELRELRVQQQVVRERRMRLGYHIELTFEYQGKHWVVGSFARELGEAFEKWARQVASR